MARKKVARDIPVNRQNVENVMKKVGWGSPEKMDEVHDVLAEILGHEVVVEE